MYLRRAGPLAVVAIVASLLSTAATARAASPIPDFPEDGVALDATVAARGGRDFDGLRRFLSSFDSQTGATYHVCVVALTDPHDRSGRQYAASAVGYVDEVFAAWRERLDPARSVVIVMSIENRGIAIHPGSAWAAVGFEKEAGTQVIDRSSFAAYARSGDFAGALQQLVGAIDMHLVLLQEQKARYERQRAAERERTAEELAAERARREQARVAERERLERERAAYLAQRQREREQAEKQRRALAEELVTGARARREQVAAGLDTVPGGGAAALRAKLAAPDDLIAKAADAAKDGRPDSAIRLAGQANDALAEIDAERDAAIAAHRFRTQTLPMIVAGVALVVLLLGVAFTRALRANRRATARGHASRWRRQLGSLGARLTALIDEHPLVFGDETLGDRFRGETGDAVAALAPLLDDVMLSFDTCRDLVERAERVIASQGGLGWARFDRATALLTLERVALRSERREGEPPLLLPHLWKQRDAAPRKTAEDLIEHALDASQELREPVAALETAMRAAPLRLGQLHERLAHAETTIRRLANLGVDVAVWSEPHAELVAGHAENHELEPADPIVALRAADGLLARAEALDGRLARCKQAADVLVKSAHEQLPKTEERIAALRAEPGLRLVEPGFEPEALAAAVREAEQESIAAMGAGEDAPALEHARRAAAGCEKLVYLVDRTLWSREKTPEMIAAQRARHAALRGHLGGRRARIEGLRAEHDDAALQPALDNAQQAEQALAFGASCCEQAETAVGEQEQRYLAGAELVRRATAVLGGVEALYAEIEQKAAQLAAARRAAESSLAAAAGSIAALGQLVAPSDRFATAATLDAIALATGDVDRERGSQGAPRANWLQRQATAAAVASHAAAVLARAQQEHAAYEKTQRMFEQVRRRHREVQSVLRGSDEDRAPANDEFRRASRKLRAASEVSEQERPDWTDVLARLRKADECLDRSSRLARRDFAAARDARGAIANAAREISSADGFYGEGVHAHLGSARSLHQQAIAELHRRQYEDALRTARQAADEADDAADDARRRARRRRDEREARERRERERRRSASMLASTTAFSSGSSSSSGSGFSSGSTFSSPSSSSFGSSFGGSSSFGSSW